MANRKIIIEGLFDRQRSLITDVINSSAKYHIINASRQASKSYTLSRLAVVLGVNLHNEHILIASPTYEQVRIIFDNILGIQGINKIIRSKKESKPSEITLDNGCRLSFKSADRPDSLRGSSNKVVLLDEFSFFKEGVFNTIIRPTTNAKIGSKIIVASTPKGKSNDFYKLAEQGIEGNKNYKYHRMHYSDNPYYDLSEVEDARLRLPKAIFQQEYEGDFIDDGGDVFEGIELVSLLEAYSNYELGNYYFAGIDFGSHKDSSVLTILDKNHRVVFMKEYTGNWTKQIDDMAIVLNNYKAICYAESNGIGDPLLTQLKTKYNNVRPFVMTNSSKVDLVHQLKLDIFTANIELPNRILCPKLSSELSDFTYSITKTGLIAYHHRLGGNDDYVDSLMIANHSYYNHNKSFTKPLAKRSSNFYNQ